MPAIFDSLVKKQHLTAHVAWRVAFIVPFIIITAIALGILFTGEDCPNGKWADRHVTLPADTSSASIDEKTGAEPTVKDEKLDTESNKVAQTQAIDEAEGEVIVAPTLKEGLSVLFSLQTLALAAPYACSFGM
jgi:NNP family nitrate/nitrite transporter-like MFS transporter